ncbi:hypothetical protein BJY01DRAFT_256328 [Aspergillus pseudoustus]|uniref:Prion-inhibition and propagation HeLo domain-containing protein n=1 Tax=Aspergillus pseudoustus TaxID=1810923 RepID=A0ABR4IBN2_9EURO
MAEVIGVVSASVGIAAFIVQITGNITWFKEIWNFNEHKAGNEVNFCAFDLAISRCQLEYSKVDMILQRLANEMSKAQQSKGAKWKVFRKSPEIRQEISIATDRINGVILDLMWWIVRSVYGLYHAKRDSSPTLSANRPYPQQTDDMSINVSECTTVTAGATKTEESDIGTIMKPNGNDSTLTMPPARALRHIKTQTCAVKRCHCACQTAAGLSGRFWGFQYTPFSTMFRSCDNARCSARRYGWNI